MLSELIEKEYGIDQDLNCAERILYGANQAYGLGLDHQALKMAAGFGGGMGIENVCGTLTASVMVLSSLFIKERAHESKKIKELTKELFTRFEKEMGSILCEPLKKEYRTEEKKCQYIIFKAAQILDEIIKTEREKSQ